LEGLKVDRLEDRRADPMEGLKVDRLEDLRVDRLEDRRADPMEGRWAGLKVDRLEDPMEGLQELRGGRAVLQRRPVSLQAPLQEVLLVPARSRALTA
jgi:hypothetical protein